MTQATTAPGDEKPRLDLDETGKYGLIIGDTRMFLGASEYAVLAPVVEHGHLDLLASEAVYGKEIKPRHADVILCNIRRKIETSHPDWVIVGQSPRHSEHKRPLQLRRRAEVEKTEEPGPGLYSSTSQDGYLQLIYEGKLEQVSPVILLVVAAAMFGKRLTKSNFGAVSQQYLGAEYEGDVLKVHVSHANHVLVRLGVPYHIGVCREHASPTQKDNFYAGLPGAFVPNLPKQAAVRVDADFACA